MQGFSAGWHQYGTTGLNPCRITRCSPNAIRSLGRVPALVRRSRAATARRTGGRASRRKRCEWDVHAERSLPHEHCHASVERRLRRSLRAVHHGRPPGFPATGRRMPRTVLRMLLPRYSGSCGLRHTKLILPRCTPPIPRGRGCRPAIHRQALPAPARGSTHWQRQAQRSSSMERWWSGPRARPSRRRLS